MSRKEHLLCFALAIVVTGLLVLLANWGWQAFTVWAPGGEAWFKAHPVLTRVLPYFAPTLGGLTIMVVSIRRQRGNRNTESANN